MVAALGVASCKECDEKDCVVLSLGLPMFYSPSRPELSIEVKQTGSGVVIASCNWTISALSQSGQWTCTADRHGKTTVTSDHDLDLDFSYDVADPGSECTITITSALGTRAIGRTPEPPRDDGEGPFPSCGCDSYGLHMVQADFDSVRM